MGLFNFLAEHDPDDEDREMLEANKFVQDTISDADQMRVIPDDQLRECLTVEDMENIEKDNRWWEFGVRRN